MPLGSFSSSPMLIRLSNPAQPALIPFQAAAPPYVDVGDEDGNDEGDHLDQAERPEVVEGDRPRVQEDDLDIEDDEEHRGQVVLHREPDPGRLAGRLDTA